MRVRLLLSHWISAGLCLALSVLGATAQNYEFHQEDRFLIVVDTSAAMRRSSNAVISAVCELFDTQMKGELRQGDTIGIWTYNDKLHTEFPMQQWRETNNADIRKKVLTYLTETRFENRSHLDKVFSDVGMAISRSERLTVIFIYDGKEAIKGTPFDLDINQTQDRFESDFRDKHAPFVTTLTARNGMIADYSISSPGSIRLPRMPLAAKPEPPPPVAAAPKPAPPPAPHVYAEIVMAGPKTPPAGLPPIVAPAPAVPEPVATNETKEVAVTNAPVAIAAPVFKPAPETNLVQEAAATEKATNAPAVVNPAPTPPPTTPTPSTQASVEASAANDGVAGEGRVGFPQVALFVIAFSLAAIALALVWVIARRGRVDSASLISQSMDQPHSSR